MLWRTTWPASYPAANQGWGIKVEPLHAAYHRQMRDAAVDHAGRGAVRAADRLRQRREPAARARHRPQARDRDPRRHWRHAPAADRAVAHRKSAASPLGGALGLLLAYVGDRLLTFAMVALRIQHPQRQSHRYRLARGLVQSRDHGGHGGDLRSRTFLGDGENGLERIAEGRWVEHYSRIGPPPSAQCARHFRNGSGAGSVSRRGSADPNCSSNLADVDLGIDPTNVITMGIRLPSYKYSSAPQQAIFFRELMQRIGTAPGVKTAGAEGGGGNVFFQPQGQPPAAPGQEPTASVQNRYARLSGAMGTHLVAGRGSTERDNQEAPPVAIVSETVARRYWPHASPIGSHLTVLARVYSGQTSKLPGPSKS